MFKSTILFFISLFASTIFCQETVIWSDPIPVAESTFSFRGPKISLNANNEPIVMWGKIGSTGGIYVARWNGTAFDLPQKVNGELLPFVNSAEGPQMKSRGDDVFVTFQDQNDDQNGIFIVKSSDGGVSFGAPVKVLNNSTNTNSLPFVGIDDNQQPVVGMLSAAGQFSNAKMTLAHSNDGGITFAEPVIASDFADGPYVCECCPGFLLFDEQREYLFFRNNDDNKRDTWMTYSDDGINYNDGLDIDDSDWQINACPASGPEAAKFGNQLVAVHMSAAGGSSQVYYSVIDATNQTLLDNRRITLDSFTGIIQNFPTIDSKNGVVGIAWEQINGFDRDIFFTYATETVADFDEHLINITGTSDYNQRFPAIAYDGEQFHLVYEDQEGGAVYYQKGVFGIPSGSVEVNNESVAKIVNTLFHNQVSIEVSELVLDVEIIAVNGKVAWSIEKLSSSKTIETVAWSSGTYFLKYSDGNGVTYYQQMMKQ